MFTMLAQAPLLPGSVHVGPIAIVVLSVLVSLAIAAVVLVILGAVERAAGVGRRLGKLGLVLLGCGVVAVLAFLTMASTTGRSLPAGLAITGHGEEYTVIIEGSPLPDQPNVPQEDGVIARAKSSRTRFLSHSKNSPYDQPQKLKEPPARTAVRMGLSLGAVGLFLYVLFLFLDGATRGHFRATLLVIMGAAFVGTCVAIVQLQ